MEGSNRNITGVILAAGAGARLRPLSFHLPKPMLPICNKPIIQHQIEFMKDIGITSFLIVVGHLGKHIMETFRNGSDMDVRIRYVVQEEPLGIAHAVYQLEEELNGPFLLFLGDIFLVPDNLSEMVRIFQTHRAGGVLAVMNENRPEHIRRNFAVTVQSDGRVSKVVEKPRYVQDTLKGCGIYLFDLPIFDAIRRTPRTAMRDEYEITTAIQILIDDGLPVFPAKVVEWDMNVTLPCDLLDCNLRLLDYSGLNRLLGANVSLADTVRIERSVIGDNIRISYPITVTNSLIMNDSIIDSARDLDSVIAFGKTILQCSPGSVG
ncbi:NTP transferase domain-containing protein [bacterium]|nr:NTP transferase domain-containing protein [candidate division CSSED10-310 bacterium]